MRNNTIRSIKQNGGEIIVSSTSDRHLVINLSKKYLNILNLILDKYQNDRLKFLDKVSDKNLIQIATGYVDHSFRNFNSESSYGIHYITKPYDLENVAEAVHLNLMEIHHKKISKFDLDFLDEYLKEFINNISLQSYHSSAYTFVNGELIFNPQIKQYIEKELNLTT